MQWRKFTWYQKGISHGALPSLGGQGILLESVTHLVLEGSAGLGRL